MRSSAEVGRATACPGTRAATSRANGSPGRVFLRRDVDRRHRLERPGSAGSGSATRGRRVPRFERGWATQPGRVPALRPAIRNVRAPAPEASLASWTLSPTRRPRASELSRQQDAGWLRRHGTNLPRRRRPLRQTASERSGGGRTQQGHPGSVSRLRTRARGRTTISAGCAPDSAGPARRGPQSIATTTSTRLAGAWPPVSFNRLRITGRAATAVDSTSRSRERPRSPPAAAARRAAGGGSITRSRHDRPNVAARHAISWGMMRDRARIRPLRMPVEEGDDVGHARADGWKTGRASRHGATTSPQTERPCPASACRSIALLTPEASAMASMLVASMP